MIKSNCGFEYETVADGLSVRLYGEIDHHSAVGLRCDVDELLCRVRPGVLYLDLSGVGFMDSSGLGFIMGRYSLLRGMDAKMIITDPSEATERIIGLAGLGRILPVKYTKKEGRVKTDEK